MNVQEKLTQRAIIKRVLLKNFDINQTVLSEHVVKTVQEQAGIKYIYPDTVLRYLRELRSSNQLDYTCTSRRSRIFTFKKMKNG